MQALPIRGCHFGFHHALEARALDSRATAATFRCGIWVVSAQDGAQDYSSMQSQELLSALSRKDDRILKRDRE